MQLRDLLTERFINLLGDDPQKQEYVDTVWDLVQQSYAEIGGIKGKGFGSKNELLSLIPFWKLVRKNGKIVAGALYRDKAGRKRVAVFTDGSGQGKQGLASIMAGDFDRAYFEISDPSLGFMIKNVGMDFVKKHAHSVESAEQIAGEPLEPALSTDPLVQKYPQLADHFYQREIGGEMHTKIMLGTTGNKIVISDT